MVIDNKKTLVPPQAASTCPTYKVKTPQDEEYKVLIIPHLVHPMAINVTLQVSWVHIWHKHHCQEFKSSCHRAKSNP